MAMLVLDGIVRPTPVAWGTSSASSSAILEPWGDPEECGLYNAPAGFAPPRELGVVITGSHHVVGRPRRPRTEG